MYCQAACMPQEAGLVVITGANRGIGLGLCEAYDKAGLDVLAVCRSASDALNSLGIPIVSGAQRHAARVSGPHLPHHICIRCLHPDHESKYQTVAGIDITQDDAWGNVHKAVAPRPIDVLILNAGILIKDDLADLSCQQDTLLEQVSRLWPSWLWCSDALTAGMLLNGCCAMRCSSA